MYKTLITTVIAFSAISFTYAEEVAVTTTAAVEVVQNVAMPEALPTEVGTGDAKVDGQILALRKEMEAKIKAIRDEYQKKLKAIVGERKTVMKEKRAEVKAQVKEAKKEMKEVKKEARQEVKEIRKEVRGASTGPEVGVRAFFNKLFGVTPADTSASVNTSASVEVTP